MFDLGWSEIAFLLALALIVIGPKDLPKLARGIGKFHGKVRRVYHDMQFSLKKLELEVDRIENPPAANGQPDYFHLLPEHVRKAMEMSEPVRDAAVKQQIEADYHTAMAEIHARQAATIAASPADAPATSATSPHVRQE